MKKILATVLILIFMTGFITPLMVGASTEDITFNVGTAEAVQGEKRVRVPIYVSGTNPGFSAVGLMVTFETEQLFLDEVRATTSELPINNPPTTPTQGTHLISLVNADTPTKEFTESGTTQGVIANLFFDVLPNAPTGNSQISLAVSPNPRFGAPTSESATRADNYVLAANYEPGRINILTATDAGPGTDPGAPGEGQFRVSFNLNGGTRTGGGDLEQNVNRGGNATLPTVTRSGYTFNGWTPANAHQNVTANVTLTAQWTADSGGGTGGGTGDGTGSGTGDGTGGGTGGGTGTTPGTTTPPAGVTRPSGAGTLTVIEHFGTWTGSGTRTAKVNADHTTFTRLWFGNNLVSTAHLTIAAGSTAITLSEAFIRNLSDGTHSFIAEFSGGHATVTLIVSRGFGNVPQTGVPDITLTMIIMGISLFFTLTAGVLLFFHLKEKRNSKYIGFNSGGMRSEKVRSTE